MAYLLHHVLLVLAACYCLSGTTSSEDQEPVDLTDVPEFITGVHRSSAVQRSLENVRIKDFKFTNCGSGDLVKINEIKISPDLKLTASIDVLQDLTAPLSVELQVTKKMPFLGWTKIPCMNNLIGSCTFKDVCSLIPKLDKCPAKLEELGLPCTCPIAAKTYTITDFPIRKEQRSVPSWMISGSFNVKAIVRASDSQLGCFNIFANVV